MALFGDLVKWAWNERPPSITQPPRFDLATEGSKALSTAESQTPRIQALESQRRNFLTGEITDVLEESSPWLKPFQAALGRTVLDLSKGELPQDEQDLIQRKRAAKNWSIGNEFGTQGSNAVLRDLGIGSLNAKLTGASTAENWLALMDKIYAPAIGTDYSSKYLPSLAQQSNFDVQEGRFQWQAENQRRQFKWATDPMRAIVSDVAGIADVVGAALSVYLGGLGGAGAMGGMAGGAGGAGAAAGAAGGGGGIPGMQMLGGMFGLGSGGGGASAQQMLTGIYQPGGYQPIPENQGGGSVNYGPSWFGATPSSQYNTPSNSYAPGVGYRYGNW